jgi:large subunit ribosomal protein L22
MADEQKKPVTEVKAFARSVHISPRKVRLVADLIRDMRVEDALAQLRFLNKKAVLPVRKLLDSAVANASHNFQITPDRLFIKSISVDGARVMKSFAPRAQGRAFALRKRLSHVNLILGVSRDAGKARKPAPAAAKKETAPQTPEEKLEVVDQETPKTPAPEKKSRFAFWNRKGKTAPKGDSKGKHYTGFDRRGNM